MPAPTLKTIIVEAIDQSQRLITIETAYFSDGTTNDEGDLARLTFNIPTWVYDGITDGSYVAGTPASGSNKFFSALSWIFARIEQLIPNQIAGTWCMDALDVDAPSKVQFDGVFTFVTPAIPALANIKNKMSRAVAPN
jgi:hypothetical protein